MSEWISLRDRIPERLQPVIVRLKKIYDEDATGRIAIYIACLCDWKDECNDWHFLPSLPGVSAIAFDEVTHWRILPSPPELPNE